MKKMLKVCALVMGLFFIATPSHALVGIDDAVPGHDIIVPFIVEMGATGLDTLIMIQEISDAALLGTPAAPAGRIHWFMYDQVSVERASLIIPYSGGDVVPLSVRDMILTAVNPAVRPALEADLDNDGTNDHWVGYIYFQNLVNVAVANNNLVSYFHYADLPAGRACGAYAAMKEWTGPVGGAAAGAAPLPPLNNVNGYNYAQIATANPTGAGTFGFVPPNSNLWLNGGATTATQFEAFSAAAYFWSAWRERATPDFVIGANADLLNFIRFVPRFYLHDVNGETYIILWKSRNHRLAAQNNPIGVFMWNENEVRYNGTIFLPNELNIIRVRDILPPGLMATYPAGGWIDIAIADPGVPFTSGYLENWRYTEFLMWTWMYARQAGASLNWASLWTDRQVGTVGNAPRPD